MQNRVAVIAVAVLVIVNVCLLIQNHRLNENPSSALNKKAYLVNLDGRDLDFRGAYTYPGIGRFFAPKDTSGQPAKAPLTLAIFFSSASSCPSRLAEVKVYERLLPIFHERGQRIVGVACPKDSVTISEGLSAESLHIPLILYDPEESDLGMTFEQMGIAPANMPFKILYDSTFTAIYMRGSDYTPQSQREFEDAMLRLSKSVAEGCI